jgi:hypothetical protein
MFLGTKVNANVLRHVHCPQPTELGPIEPFHSWLEIQDLKHRCAEGLCFLEGPQYKEIVGYHACGSCVVRSFMDDHFRTNHLAKTIVNRRAKFKWPSLFLDLS